MEMKTTDLLKLHREMCQASPRNINEEVGTLQCDPNRHAVSVIRVDCH